MVRKVSQQSDGLALAHQQKSIALWGQKCLGNEPTKTQTVFCFGERATFSRLGLRENEPHHLGKPRSEEGLDRQAGRRRQITDTRTCFVWLVEYFCQVLNRLIVVW